MQGPRAHATHAVQGGDCAEDASVGVRRRGPFSQRESDLLLDALAVNRGALGRSLSAKGRNMRIVVANKFWYRRGGLEGVMFDEIEWLESAGHEIAHFSTNHPSNELTPWATYFVPYLELGANGNLSMTQKAHAALRMFSNVDAARLFDLLLRDFRPHVVHVHGIHRQISPSILTVARRHGIPVVQSLHDYHHVCPAADLLRRGVAPCEPRRCGRLWYGPCVGGRCVRDGLTVSALAAAETTWQRATLAYERGIARFICPSHFMALQMRQGGWTQPCDLVPNAVQLGRENQEPGDAFCIVGRLSREKGVGLALEAARRACVRVVVAGEGPASAELRRGYPEVEFVGNLDRLAVRSLMERSKALVVPSIWFENASISVLEAMAAGRPVVASRIGGIAEQVTHDVDGLLVRPGDVDALAHAMRQLADDAELAGHLGAAALRTVATRFTPAQHVHRLLGAYGAALASASEYAGPASFDRT